MYVSAWPHAQIPVLDWDMADLIILCIGLAGGLVDVWKKERKKGAGDRKSR